MEEPKIMSTARPAPIKQTLKALMVSGSLLPLAKG